LLGSFFLGLCSILGNKLYIFFENKQPVCIIDVLICVLMCMCSNRQINHNEGVVAAKPAIFGMGMKILPWLIGATPDTSYPV